MSVKFVSELRPSRDSVEEQHRAISLVCETCDDLLSQTVRFPFNSMKPSVQEANLTLFGRYRRNGGRRIGNF